MADHEYIGPSKVAELLNVNSMTVRRMSDKGMLPFSITPGGHRRYKMEDIVAYCKAHNIELAQQKEKVKRILLVDDEPQILELLKLFIGKIDNEIEVEKSSDGFDAGLKLMEFMPSIVITDLMMPKVDGIEVCKRIKQSDKTRGIAVVGITGTNDPVLIKRFYDAGGYMCLAKPIDRNEFAGVIGALL